MSRSLMLPVLVAALLAGCSASGDTPADAPVLASMTAPPPMGWDHRPEADEWTSRALAAVAAQDAALAASVPADIGTWCPGYVNASIGERRAFWSGLMSAVAKYESSWNPKASGAGGRYIGVMQISPASARHHGCSADTAGELKDGAANLECAAGMIAKGVAADGMVAGSGKQGAGRDWMPFRNAEKRTAMAAWTRAQPYCAI